MPESRRLTLTLEVDTKAPLALLRRKDVYALFVGSRGDYPVTVRQAQVNAIRQSTPAKPKAAARRKPATKARRR